MSIQTIPEIEIIEFEEHYGNMNQKTNIQVKHSA